MEQLLKEGLEMMDNVENPKNETHGSVIYCDKGHHKLRQVGQMVYQKHPNLADMITFAQVHIPEKYHGIINHSWSGIGDWQA